MIVAALIPYASPTLPHLVPVAEPNLEPAKAEHLHAPQAALSERLPSWALGELSAMPLTYPGVEPLKTEPVQSQSLASAICAAHHADTRTERTFSSG